jgi:hypothetical protein
MRIFIHLIFVIILTVGCDRTKNSGTGDVVLIDTLYGGDFLWRQKREDKRITVLIDNGTDRGNPVFKLNEENLLRIRIKRFFEYEIYPSEIHGAEIVKVDSSLNLFLFTPRDSSFSFVVNQYYPKGRVIRCLRNWNKETDDFDEQLDWINGFAAITHFEGRCK